MIQLWPSAPVTQYFGQVQPRYEIYNSLSLFYTIIAQLGKACTSSLIASANRITQPLLTLENHKISPPCPNSPSPITISSINPSPRSTWTTNFNFLSSFPFLFFVFYLKIILHITSFNNFQFLIFLSVKIKKKGPKKKKRTKKKKRHRRFHSLEPQYCPVFA